MLAIIINVILLISLLILIFWTYCKLSIGTCRYSGHLVGKVVVITGANSGIGFETAKDLAQRGAFIIAACRNIENGEIAVKKIITSSCNEDVHFIQLDLASFTSIRKFVDKVSQLVAHVDILINNAGLYTSQDEKTEDGFLVGIQVNYLGPFLLTSLLLPLLKTSAPSRIINVTSMLYKEGVVNFDDFEKPRHFSTHTIYRNSKLYVTLMATELDRQLQGTGVTVNCLHPGVVNTEMFDQIDICIVRATLKILRSFFKSAWEGAQTTIFLSVSPDVAKVSGSYFEDCREVSLKPKAKNINVAVKLWKMSEKFVKLK